MRVLGSQQLLGINCCSSFWTQVVSRVEEELDQLGKLDSMHSVALRTMVDPLFCSFLLLEKNQPQPGGCPHGLCRAELPGGFPHFT